MERESQELRAHSQSWPPGFFVGSVALNSGKSRRDGLVLVGLAACAWCFGFAATDWVCDVKAKTVAANLTEHNAVAVHRSHNAPATGAIQPTLAAQPSAPEAAAAHEDAREVAAPAAPRKVALRAAKQVVSGPLPKIKRVAVAAVVEEEPSPAVSVDEVHKELAIADASQRIFASVDEKTPAPEVLEPPPPMVVAAPATPKPAVLPKPQPMAAAVPAREPAAHKPALQEEPMRPAEAVAIEGLLVEGALPSKVVTRGVQRLMSQYDRCKEFCDSAPQRVQLSTTIDEAGRGRRITIEGPSQPRLRNCLEQATAHLVVPAPDTGTARARWTVRFTP
jgi:hypothetical protein